jgi:hypothetical protein
MVERSPAPRLKAMGRGVGESDPVLCHCSSAGWDRGRDSTSSRGVARGVVGHEEGVSRIEGTG